MERPNDYMEGTEEIIIELEKRTVELTQLE